ncbi:MAG: prepilin-type N-terminal cleavage/methylation domain-containing protein [Candidatus Aureabacteria bacterium]|nr:prepilin-type N-terminal cleavage/methylation domain-containing protein [Candidatus Auribacterota bacterium]
MLKLTSMKKQGFTLVEMMIVLAILGLLLGLGIPGFLRARDRARRDTCVNNLRMIEHASDQYRIDNNMAVTASTRITWLWPSSSASDVKDVSSYINRQLFCPSRGTYKGGTNAGGVPTDDSLEANAVPHCVTPSNSSTITAPMPDFRHEISNS